MTRIKVILARQFVEVFDHSTNLDPQLLPFKERFLPADHPDRKKMDDVSAKLRRLGMTPENVGHGPTAGQLRALLDSAGFSGKRGWNLVKISPPRDVSA